MRPTANIRLVFNEDGVTGERAFAKLYGATQYAHGQCSRNIRR